MTVYRIDNWSQYNKALVNRGDIAVWFSDEAIKAWHCAPQSGEKGRSLVYSDDAILCALILKAVFKLPLRSLEGFMRSLVRILGVAIKIPSYTQICRRAKVLGRALKKLSNRRPKDVVFDSTGLKVYGEGEWKVRQHGRSKRRTWRKLHIGVDPDSQEIIIGELTTNGKGSGDGQIGRKLARKLPKGLKRVFADGAYDEFAFRRAIEDLQAEAIVPPPRNGVVSNGKDPALVKRDNALKEILGLGGDKEARALWKKLSAYHRRSLVETAMYRIKQLTGSNLTSRTLDRQKVEAHVKCLVVNMMTKLGMPIGHWEDAA